MFFFFFILFDVGVVVIAIDHSEASRIYRFDCIGDSMFEQICFVSISAISYFSVFFFCCQLVVEAEPFCLNPPMLLS